MRHFALRLTDWCERATTWLLSIWMGLMVVLGFYQVLARFVLYEPSSWSEEFLRRAMIWMVALGLSIGFRHGAHICVDVINRVRSPTFRAGIRWLVFGVTMSFLIVLVVLGADMAWRVRFQSFASLELSMTWAYAAIPTGALLSVVALLAQFLSPRVAAADEELGGMPCQQ